MEIPMLKIKQLQDLLVFNKGIPVLVRRQLYFERPPGDWYQLCLPGWYPFLFIAIYIVSGLLSIHLNIWIEKYLHSFYVSCLKLASTTGDKALILASTDAELLVIGKEPLNYYWPLSNHCLSSQKIDRVIGFPHQSFHPPEASFTNMD